MRTRDSVEVLDETYSSGDLYGGGEVVYRTDDKVHIEAWYELSDRPRGDTDPEPWDRYVIYQTPVPDDVYAEHTWVKASEIDGGDEEEGRDPDPIKRARQISAITAYYGWEEFDQYPLQLTATELYQRWGAHVSEDPRRDYLDYDTPLTRRDVCLDKVSLTPEDRAYLAGEGAKQLYGVLLSSQLGGWDFTAALREAIQKHGKTYDVDAHGNSRQWHVASELRQSAARARLGLSPLPVEERPLSERIYIFPDGVPPKVFFLEDPDDPNQSNANRAERAARGVVAYLNGSSEGEDVATALSDLLGDLRHLCDGHGLDFDELSQLGRYHHREESDSSRYED